MRILDFGSVNRDYVYSVKNIVTPGQTISSSDLLINWGGKGFNQCIAAARGGGDVTLACHINPSDLDALLATLAECGAKADFVETCDLPTGHAIIQVDQNGQNSIIVYAGANHMNTTAFIDRALDSLSPGDIVLLTNEVNELPYIIDSAYSRGLTVALNPSPFTDILRTIDPKKIGIYILNEEECRQFTGISDPYEAASELCERSEGSTIVETLGSKGCVCIHKGKTYRKGIYEVDVVDTTAAGDTFTGFFLAAYTRNEGIDKSLMLASRAASITVSRKGAVSSIPTLSEVKGAIMRLIEVK